MSANVQEATAPKTAMHDMKTENTKQDWLTQNGYRLVFAYLMLRLLTTIVTDPALEKLPLTNG